jgi:tRNA (guanine37-N1)-methyltransferase
VDFEVALIHYPILNKWGEVVTTSVTNLDLHDISRSCTSFGAKGFFVVTPNKDQQELVQRVLSHWREGGAGEKFNPVRHHALKILALKESLEEVRADMKSRYEKEPFLIATTARGESIKTQGFEAALEQAGDRPLLILFGTGWGLAPSALEKTDLILDPIWGDPKNPSENHLSVRSAVAIYLDRLNQLKN